MIITALFIRKGLRLLVQFMQKQYFVFINYLQVVIIKILIFFYSSIVSILNHWFKFYGGLFDQDNAARMQILVDELNSRIAHIVRGGGEKAIERHTSRGNTWVWRYIE